MDPAAAEKTNETAQVFRKLWPRVTDDDNLALHGFRRFKTAHLLNLRFLEQEIAEVDRAIYQAGLSLGHEPSTRDRLGLKHSTIDPNPPALKDTITQDLVLKLRNLLQQYDEALSRFGNIMAMETVSLLDDGKQSSLQTELTLLQKYKTRLVRADLGTRSRTDPFQRWLHRKLRAFRYWRISNQLDGPESLVSSLKHHWPHQNTVRIASIVERFIAAVVTGAFLVAPLAILSARSINGTQLTVVCVFVVLFAAVVTAMLRVSSYEIMAATAAYAAVLSVFVSNGS